MHLRIKIQTGEMYSLVVRTCTVTLINFIINHQFFHFLGGQKRIIQFCFQTHPQNYFTSMYKYTPISKRLQKSEIMFLFHSPKQKE